MRSFTNPIQLARHALMNDKAWLFFVEIARKAGGYYRLVKSARHVTADGKFWQACGLEPELPGEDSEGRMGEVSLVIGDVSRLAIAAVEVDNELVGSTLTVSVQHESNLASFDPSLRWKFVVTAAEANELGVKLTCGHPAQIGRVPKRVFSRALFPQLLPTGV